MYTEERLRNITDSDIQQAFKKIQGDTLAEGRLELITEDCFPKVLETLKECFIDNEPLEKSLQMQWSSDMEDVWLNALKYNLSLMLVDKESEEIIGVRVIRVTRKSDYFEKNKYKDERVIKLLNFFDFTTDKCDFFSKFGVTEIFEFFGLGVVRKYRRRGFGKLLMETGVKFLDSLGIKPCYIRGSASSNFSKTIFEKCGFESVAEFSYEDYKVNGSVIFDNTGEHKSMTVYAKSLV
ncbi:uncharacterized protein LOC128548827 [Mercenaria mercenaria]|uniref:uncharacterized protein LOC128548827 n=1 Tax=Mercenaria mercenaria TaxID=6596 RepID=UPI00234F3FCD|nr:uncharacterized protein LOC128548827 [Mercenaria mercenaria]